METAAPRAASGELMIDLGQMLRFVREELGRLSTISEEAEDAVGELAGSVVLAEDVRLQRLDALTQILRGLQVVLTALEGVDGMECQVDPYALTASVSPRDLAHRLQPREDVGANEQGGDIDFF